MCTWFLLAKRGNNELRCKQGGFFFKSWIKGLGTCDPKLFFRARPGV